MIMYMSIKGFVLPVQGEDRQGANNIHLLVRNWMNIDEGSKNFETFPTKNLHLSTPTLVP